ncbi:MULTISPECIES: arsenic resistance protein [unclassified Microbacterium]|uniref:arsenic resistance protein n=1 Tax=unclassified Microbacterium TaxID=2609290 RepID=UPI0016052C55|nr:MULTISPECIES: arsenic resistance protein [unclassified Microbacterium]QNA91869.1 arsenic resistance protein [Microbacterium sp. Se63.02b]QYM65091.1 arsenic resistance protein [Microbacterium sp. Se5.02b]
MVAWGERNQVALYAGAIVVGGVVGLLAPWLAAPLETAITPLLGVLLFATFLGVPFAAIGRAFADRRFLVVALVLNFVVAPVVAFGLSRTVAGDAGILLGVLLVLLTPCVDYVIVFAGLAGGDRTRLLAATPLLMLLQMVLLPVFLTVMVGSEATRALDPRPLLAAFALLIVLPLVLAALTQLFAARVLFARGVERASASAMVPVMMLTLATIVASQISSVSDEVWQLALVVPVFLGFALILAPLGAILARIARLDAPGSRAVVFSGVTRNSLVVLPLALALPEAFALAPLVVVTQTLVELVVMVIMVAVVPRWIR